MTAALSLSGVTRSVIVSLALRAVVVADAVGEVVVAVEVLIAGVGEVRRDARERPVGRRGGHRERHGVAVGIGRRSA